MKNKQTSLLSQFATALLIGPHAIDTSYNPWLYA